ncbi:MAG TPA: NAD(P)-dependent oxidoreductase [Streptosporangiaceae bacterium]|jgi:nucleoside-diphosphate-sugar epimerase|nr:NAD(P)-dependent oxidoreductase [Streptosporangiaceae bacterium]
MRVLVAGATGAVGKQLVPQLIAAGHQVTATTRSPGKAAGLQAAGVDVAVVDGLDAIGVGEAVARAEPEVVIHQMTALSDFDLRHIEQTFAGTNELRTTGLDNLMAAARAAGARRMIVQSYTGWPNIRTGSPVKTEDDPLDPDPPQAMLATLDAIRYLENAVVSSPMEGVVLRYGSLYGPGATDLFIDMIKRRQVPVIGNGAGIWSFTHIEDAARAAVATLDRGDGIYNIVDDEPAPVSEWLPALAAAVGAKRPFRLPAWLGRLAAGDAAVSMMTQVRGSSNAKAKRELPWVLGWPTWRDGFTHGLHTVADQHRASRP